MAISSSPAAIWCGRGARLAAEVPGHGGTAIDAQLGAGPVPVPGEGDGMAVAGDPVGRAEQLDGDPAGQGAPVDHPETAFLQLARNDQAGPPPHTAR